MKAEEIKQKVASFFDNNKSTLALNFEIKNCENSQEKFIEVTQKGIKLGSKIHLFVLNFEQSDENQDRLLNRYTAGIFHSNWLVQNFSQSENAWQAVKLFRFVREWK